MGFFNRSKDHDTQRSDSDLEGYIKPKPTKLRIFVGLIYLIALVFLLLVEIGNINNNVVIRDTYFMRINLANIIPASVPNAIFVNSIARSIGLHDFYQVGLWNFCEGFVGEGITYCSPTESLYWFNPVQIILNELLAGASITLPTDVLEILDVVQLASAWMFACFLVGTILTFLCIFIAPIGFSQKPRWEHKRKRIFFRQFPVTILTFLAALFTAAGSVIATVMFIIFRQQFSGAADLNINVHLGTPMLAFIWTATALNLLGFVIQVGTCCGVCCCTGRSRAMRNFQQSSGTLFEKSPSTRRKEHPGQFGFRRRLPESNQREME